MICVHPNSDLVYDPIDDSKHSVTCDICGYKLDPEAHDFIDGVCDACGYECTHDWENKDGKDPLGALSLNIKLMTDSIPAGANGLLAIIDGVDAPIECTFNAETGVVTFEADTFGNITFAFI